MQGTLTSGHRTKKQSNRPCERGLTHIPSPTSPPAAQAPEPIKGDSRTLGGTLNARGSRSPHPRALLMPMLRHDACLPPIKRDAWACAPQQLIPAPCVCAKCWPPNPAAPPIRCQSEQCAHCCDRLQEYFRTPPCRTMSYRWRARPHECPALHPPSPAAVPHRRLVSSFGR